MAVEDWLVESRVQTQQLAPNEWTYIPLLRVPSRARHQIKSTTLFQQGSPLSSTADIQRGPASIHYIYKDENVIMDIILLKVKILN